MAQKKKSKSKAASDSKSSPAQNGEGKSASGRKRRRVALKEKAPQEEASSKKVKGRKPGGATKSKKLESARADGKSTSAEAETQGSPSSGQLGAGPGKKSVAKVTREKSPVKGDADAKASPPQPSSKKKKAASARSVAAGRKPASSKRTRRAPVKGSRSGAGISSSAESATSESATSESATSESATSESAVGRLVSLEEVRANADARGVVNGGKSETIEPQASTDFVNSPFAGEGAVSELTKAGEDVAVVDEPVATETGSKRGALDAGGDRTVASTRQRKKRKKASSAKPSTTPPVVELSEEEENRIYLKGLLEALLFSSDKPLTLRELGRAAKLDKKRTSELFAELRQDYSRRGMALVEIAGGWSMRTHPDYAQYVQKMQAMRPVRLSRPQLETLSIIAYRQPMTRPEVDDIRGVDSGQVIKGLLDRDLLKVLGKKDEAGRPMLYGTTEAFLELFSLESLKELPSLKEFTELSDDSRGKFENEIGEPAPQGDEQPGAESGQDAASEVNEASESAGTSESEPASSSESEPDAESDSESDATSELEESESTSKTDAALESELAREPELEPDAASAVDGTSEAAVATTVESEAAVAAESQTEGVDKAKDSLDAQEAPTGEALEQPSDTSEVE